MLSVGQIRAARALLNWSQGKLAQMTGLSTRALAQIEGGQTEPRLTTMGAIEDALIRNGVEFLEGSGVRLAKARLGIERFEGDAAAAFYLDDILKELPIGGEVMVSNIDEHLLEEAAPKALENYFKKSEKQGITERVLTPDDNKTFFTYEHVNYRVLPREHIGDVPMAIYGNTTAVWIWGPPVQIVFMRNKALSDSFRKQFELHWNMAKPKKVRKA